MALSPAFERFERTWITAPGSSAEDLALGGERVLTLPRFHGVSPLLPAYGVRAAALVLRERPRLVVTSGSGSVGTFVAAAKVTGARVIFTETMARVHDASTTGRYLNKIADRTIVQWPDMARTYPGAVVARPALLEQRSQAGPADGRGTFIAVGTHIDAFNRLLRVASDAISSGVLPGPALAQSGVCTSLPANIPAQQWMSPAELDDAIARSRFVVTHAGSGMIARCLRRGIRPLVLPRLSACGEHVDDHQLQLGRLLAAAGCIVLIEGDITPSDVMTAETPPPPAQAGDLPAMIEVLERALEALEPGTGSPRGFRR